MTKEDAKEQTDQSGFLRHIEICTRHDSSAFVRFWVAGQAVGFLTHAIATLLCESGLGFLRGEHAGADGIALDSRYADFESRTEVLARATDLLCAHYGKTRRNELYPVFQNWGDEPLAAIDRVAVPWFGTRGFGVHVNGFVRKPDGLFLWVAERAHDRLIDPGKLDHIIAGGSPLGLSTEENLLKESWEEAGVPADLARTSVAQGAITYKVDHLLGLRHDTLFIFDLELPVDFMPRNTDGEVASFNLLPVETVQDIVRTTDRFKFNCNLVIVDFLLRHGFLDEKSYPDVAAALARLRAA